jgi:hypothetical protein
VRDSQETKPGWSHVKIGLYRYEDEKHSACVRLEGELWKTEVFFKGTDGLEAVNYDEWESRYLAMVNARRSMKHSLRLRSPIAVIEKRDRDDEGDDDE